jgi:hypothetical protein
MMGGCSRWGDSDDQHSKHEPSFTLQTSCSLNENTPVEIARVEIACGNCQTICRILCNHREILFFTSVLAVFEILHPRAQHLGGETFECPNQS